MTGSLDLAFCLGRPEDTTDDRLALLRSAGFDGVELWPAPLAARSLAEWAAALDDAGLRVLQLCPYFDFVHGPQACEASRETLEHFLSAARALNCRRLRVFTGPPWGEGVVGAEHATEEQWRSAIEMLQEFCDRAAVDQVELCLEVHEGSLAENGRTTRRLLDGVNRPNLTVNLQLPLHEEPWEDSLRLLGASTTHIHMHNWEADGGLTWLDDGIFDWQPVLETLVHDLGRDLCLSVEHPDHNRGDDPWETARRDGAFLNELRANL